MNFQVHPEYYKVHFKEALKEPFKDFMQAFDHNLKNLFPVDNPRSNNFQLFLEDYQVDYLAGENSPVFVIKAREGGAEICALKAEQRLNPIRAEKYLRSHALKDNLLPVYAERLIMAKTQTKSMDQGEMKAEMEVRSLKVMSFVPEGNLVAQADKEQSLKLSNPMQFYSNVLNIYTQMAEVLLRMQEGKRSCIFPDMNNSNWLLNSQGKLCIADGKSVDLAYGKEGNIDAEARDKFFSRLIFSEYAFPPDFVDRTADYPVDALHVYILGKNLYQYVTNCSTSQLFEMASAEQFDFSDPFFADSNGQKFVALIQSMTQKEHQVRPALKTVVAQLSALQSSLQLSPETKELTTSPLTGSHSAALFTHTVHSSNPASPVVTDDTQEKTTPRTSVSK